MTEISQIPFTLGGDLSGAGGTLSSSWSTGDAKLTFKQTADPGWLLMNDSTIGSAASGATYANAAAQALFTLFYASPFTDANVPLLTSAGAATTRAAQGTAAAAWAANCRMTLPLQLGRSIAIAGSGAGLTTRTLGGADGVETQTLTTSQLPAHNHGVSDPSHTHGVSDPSHSHGISDPGHTHGPPLGLGFWIYESSGGNNGPYSGGTMTGQGRTGSSATGIGINGAYTGISINGADTGITTTNTGSGSPVSTMDPRSYWNVMIKL
jgi:hypothetical protein